MAAVLVVLLTCWAGFASRGSAQPAPIFRFHADEFWLNLHQFLYVLGRHEAGLPDRTRRATAGAPADQEKGFSAMSADEQKSWRASVSAYAKGPSRLDAVFDDPLIALAHAFVRAGSASALATREPDPDIAAALERVAPIYRRVWWPEHQRANHAWMQAAETLVARHGRAVLDLITRAYGLPWPASGYPVHVTAYTNWAGAFSTRGDLLLVSSLDPGNRDMYSLEVVFHEAMHQWDDEVERVLTREASRRQLRVPDWMSHALIFYTAGEAVRTVSSDHVPYAEANGIWKQRGRDVLKTAMDEIWKPYLLGKGGRRDDVLGELLKRTNASIYNSSPPPARAVSAESW
jgi:hypothetical protein